MRKRLGVALALAIAMLTSGATCGRIAPYSEEAYRQAVTLKVDALAVMDSATTPYADHAKQVQELLHRVDQAYEYAKGRPNNEISTRQWEVLRADSGASLGSFFVRWKERGTLSPTFVKEAKGQIALHFDQIIQLESGKIKSNNIH
jgi:hypothetical protein